jgi:predicted RNA-binding protein with PUA-like domain
MVDVKLERKLKRIIPLAELKARRELQGMTLLRPGNRLSVMPVEERHWNAILKLERAG